MTSLPRVAIGLVTYKRTEMALQTIRSTFQNLQYPKELLGWYVGDDGSGYDHIHAIKNLIDQSQIKFGSGEILGFHSERMRHEGQGDTHNAGIGWNKCLGICHQWSDYVLWLEDDWNLDEPLDLVPYVKLLQNNEEVGICSFRILSTGADLHTVGYDGNVYLQYERRTQYAFSGNPYLRHARYTRHYGTFAEDRNPGLMELHQDDQYRLAVHGPRIWRPANISIWGSWKHIGSEKSWS